MKIVYKYRLSVCSGIQKISMHKEPYSLDVQMQHGRLVLWALVDTGGFIDYVDILVYGTGCPIYEHGATYIGTAQDGDMVWHVFGYGFGKQIT